MLNDLLKALPTVMGVFNAVLLFSVISLFVSRFVLGRGGRVRTAFVNDDVVAMEYWLNDLDTVENEMLVLTGGDLPETEESVDEIADRIVRLSDQGKKIKIGFCERSQLCERLGEIPNRDNLDIFVVGKWLSPHFRIVDNHYVYLEEHPSKTVSKRRVQIFANSPHLAGQLNDDFAEIKQYAAEHSA